MTKSVLKVGDGYDTPPTPHVWGDIQVVELYGNITKAEDINLVIAAKTHGVELYAKDEAAREFMYNHPKMEGLHTAN